MLPAPGGGLQLAVSVPTQPERGLLALEPYAALAPDIAHEPATDVL